MLISGTNISINVKNYNNPNTFALLKNTILPDTESMFLWDTFKGYYRLAVNHVSGKRFFFTVKSVSFEIIPDADLNLYPESLRDLRKISQSAKNMISAGAMFFVSKEFDCILLDTKSGKVTGTGVNIGESLFGLQDTRKCKRVLYMSI